MAVRPILETREERRKRAEEAKRRVLSGQSKPVPYERPFLEPDPPPPSGLTTFGGKTVAESLHDFTASKPVPSKSIQPDFLKPQAAPGSLSAIQNFSKNAPPPAPKPKSKGVAVAMADTLGGIANGLTGGLTAPAVDRFKRYIGEENTATALPQARREDIHAKHGEQIGEGIGMLGSGAGAFKAASALTAPVVSKLPGLVERGIAPIASRLGPQAGALTRIGAQTVGKGLGMAATGATTGALFQTPFEATEAMYGKNDQTLGEHLTDIGKSAALGAVLDPAIEGYTQSLGPAFKQLFKRNGMADDAATKEVEKIIQNKPKQQLALPLGREDAARLRRAPQGAVNDTIADPYTFGLPSPKTADPVATSARITQRANPWREKYNQLIGLAHETKFTPGRELEELEQLWAGIASKEDPNLDELIKLAHPTYFNKVEPGLVSKAKGYQTAREVAGAPLPIKGTERIPQGAIAEAAPIIQKVGRRPLEPQTLKVEPAKAPEAKLKASAPQLKKQKTQPKPLKVQPLKQKKTTDVEPPKQSEDIVDDLTPDEPDEVAPRVRDRVNSFADDMIANAKAELAKSRNRLSSNPADVYGQYAKLGAAYMLKGSVKLADLTEAMVKDFGEEIRPHVRKFFKESKEQYKVFKKQIVSKELGLESLDATELKDLTNINLNTADVYRNFKKVFGDHYESVKKSILDPFDKSKGEYASEQKNLTDKLHKDIVKGLGIQKGSKESALVQKYGERMMDDGYKQLYDDGKLSREMLNQFNLEKLKEQAPKDWEKIVKADKWFRAEYGRLIDRVNESVAKIYPNRPEKLVPKRQDYFHHFKELTTLSGIQNMFDAASGKINATLSGVSPFTQPKSKFAGYMQKRGLGEFKNDAVGGFLKYVPAASYSIHIDPHIAVFRNLAKRLGEDTEKTGNINNFKAFLENYANDLAGKTSNIDRWMHETLGRKGTKALMTINNRVKSNVILGSLRSTLAQTANIPQGIAFAKHHSAEGALKTISSVFRPNLEMDASDFMRERYVGSNFRRFNTKMLDQPRNFAEWMMETTDRVGTSFVWNSALAKGKALKVANPVKYADEHTRRLVAGRGVGEVPLLQKSKTMQLLAPFQLEVGNLWRVMKDFVSEKDFVGLATLFAANFLLNKGIEATTGSGVTFDPIEAGIESSESGLSPLERGGRVGGEILSNLPGGQTVASWYPEYGMSLGGVKLPTRKKLFGDNDPTRFGSGLVVEKALSDPVFKMALPFGGNQLKKTITGGESLVRGGAYKETSLTAGTNLLKKNELKFKVKRDLPDAARALAFGPTATKGGQEYYNEERRPLSEKQTEQFRRSSNPDQFYDRLMVTRESDTKKRKISEIAKDKTLKPEQRKKEITKIQGDIRKLTSSLSPSTR